jgi:hypothetical protein
MVYVLKAIYIDNSFKATSDGASLLRKIRILLAAENVDSIEQEEVLLVCFIELQVFDSYTGTTRLLKYITLMHKTY